jgi:DNA (cytosine-5)-methyltransferase 1
VKYKVLDLFSGIGGFSLGLEKTGGFETVAFCEISPASRKVLKKHWPDTPIYEDVRQLKSLPVEVDVVTGGFPCQDISFAGKGLGIKGPRSSLWFEFERIIKLTKPKYVIIENTTGLLLRGLDAVLHGLHSLRYDAEWHCIPAAAIGAFHARDRVWIVAYPEGHLFRAGLRKDGAQRHGNITADSGNVMAIGDYMAKYIDPRIQKPSIDVTTPGRTEKHRRLSNIWADEPDVGRVVDGVPRKLDRLEQLGNAIVPQMAELIGYAIMDFEKGEGHAKTTSDL